MAAVDRRLETALKEKQARHRKNGAESIKDRIRQKKQKKNGQRNAKNQRSAVRHLKKHVRKM